MDAEEGVKCLSTHLKQAAVPQRALSFMTAGERRKMEREGEEKRSGQETREGENEVRLAIISRSSVSCDTKGMKADNHPKAAFFVKLGCTLFHKAFYRHIISLCTQISYLRMMKMP